jgi:hypothetical protein
MQSDPARIRSIRSQIALWGRIMRDPEKPSWHVALAGRTVAELQLELEALDGTPPSVTLADCEAYEASVSAANERVIRGEVPPMSGTRINGVGIAMERETELVDDPVSAALRMRQARRASTFASPAPLPLGFGGGYSDGGGAFASETGDLHSRNQSVPRTHHLNLSGATVDE